MKIKILYRHQIGKQRSASVCFIGLFDTVGSFDMPGNADNSEFQLTLQPQDVGRAFQLCAHHEYRINFPLTSLRTKGKLPPNFYEEVFPGAHTDVGGGYPFVQQYAKTDLPKRYGVPTNSTYNRELAKTLALEHLRQQYNYRGGISDFNEMLRREQASHQLEWNDTCQAQYGQKGLVALENNTLYFYRLQPIDASLAGLSQERMKQQAERFGVEWDEDDYKTAFKGHDYHGSPAQSDIWPVLESRKLGSITPEAWHNLLPTNAVHRSHDSVINPGCSDPIDSQVNGIANLKTFKRYQPNQPLNTPTREIYDNE